MKIIPTDDRVVVQKSRFEEEITKSGIVLTSKQKKNSNQGKIISIGKEVDTVSINDTIVYSDGIGVELHLEGETYVILKQDDILAIIN